MLEWMTPVLVPTHVRWILAAVTATLVMSAFPSLAAAVSTRAPAPALDGPLPEIISPVSLPILRQRQVHLA